MGAKETRGRLVMVNFMCQLYWVIGGGWGWEGRYLARHHSGCFWMKLTVELIKESRLPSLM